MFVSSDSSMEKQTVTGKKGKIVSKKQEITDHMDCPSF